MTALTRPHLALWYYEPPQICLLVSRKSNIHVDKEVILLRADSVVSTLGVLWDGSYLCFHYTVLTGTTNFGSHATNGAIIFATSRILPKLFPVLKLHYCQSKRVCKVMLTLDRFTAKLLLCSLCFSTIQ